MSPRKIYGYNLSNSKFLSSLSAARSLTIDEIPSGRFFNLNRGVTDKIRTCLSVAGGSSDKDVCPLGADRKSLDQGYTGNYCDCLVHATPEDGCSKDPCGGLNLHYCAP